MFAVIVANVIIVNGKLTFKNLFVDDAMES
jgi:hypothetical protein